MDQTTGGRWYKRIAPIMEWDATIRSCLPLLLLLLLYSTYIAWGFVLPLINDGQTAFDLGVFQTQLPIVLSLMIGAAVLVLVGALLYLEGTPSIFFQYVAANYYGLVLIWGGYLTGGLSFASGVALLGAPMVGFLLLERRVVLVAFTVSFLGLMAVNIGAATGYLEYAPLIIEPYDRASALAWTHTHMVMAAPHVMSQVFIAALMLGQWRLRESRAKKRSLTDILTGVHNRRSLFQILEERLEHRQGPMAVAILDLDHFKTINDTHGHPMGDSVLKRAATVLEGELAEGDEMGRFGGEEFLFILPGRDCQQTVEYLNALRQRLKDCEIETENGERIALSGSFGLAWLGEDTDARGQSDALVNLADDALYQAKEKGRDRVEGGAVDADTLAAMPVNQHRNTAQQSRRHFSEIKLREFLRFKTWRRVAGSILEWSSTSKGCLMAVVLFYMATNLFFWLLSLIRREDAEQIIDVEVAHQLLILSALTSGIAIVLFAFGRWLNRVRPDARFFLALMLVLYSVVLVSFGYYLGILYMPSGALLLTSAILGFLVFDRREILPALLFSMALLVFLAYASALGWLPYAPLISTGGEPAWHLSTPFWVTSNYFFITVLTFASFALMGYIITRWHKREGEVRRLSLVDPLTLVHSRHSILEELAKVWKESRENDSPLSVVMLDLDKFKKVNDTWGHPLGDVVLCAAASTVEDMLREGDSIGRYGGEEFMLVLRDSDEEGAMATAERCRRALTHVEIYSDEGERVPVTASFGVVSNAHNAGESIEALIKRADDALYRAKYAGRNQVISG
ncbi:MAG: GGDEF domain-containing protein [Pseudomonadota bacterium]